METTKAGITRAASVRSTGSSLVDRLGRDGCQVLESRGLPRAQLPEEEHPHRNEANDPTDGRSPMVRTAEAEGVRISSEPHGLLGRVSGRIDRRDSHGMLAVDEEEHVLLRHADGIGRASI